MSPATVHHLYPDPDLRKQEGDQAATRPPSDHPETVVLEAVAVGRRGPGVRATLATTGRLAVAVARHPATVATVRHALYVADGARVVGRRAWDSRTPAKYDRAYRSAEAGGNQEAMLEWDARKKDYAAARHNRRAWLLTGLLAVVPRLHHILLGVIGILLAIGGLLAWGTRDAEQIRAPFLAIAAVVRLVAAVVTFGWTAAPYAGPPLAVLWLWARGRTAAGGTGWAVRTDPDRGDAGIIVTADTIVLALRNLRIPEMKRAFKEGWQPAFSLQPVKEGRGYHAVCSLPLGVTADMVADQRPVLARNLHRAEIEVWPADAEKAGTGRPGDLDLYIADLGALSKPAPEYPLLHEGAADVFEGVPAGVSPRGDAISVPIVGNNFCAGGQMGQGKSNACRAIILGCALDPLAELDVFVFANNGDFDAFEPRLTRYHKGIDDGTAYAALRRLHELYAEVGRREGRLAELGAKKVTRQLAMEHPDLRPIVSLFSECHELFGHPEVGEEAGEIACKTAKRGRKTAMTQGYDTQSSRKEAIPPKLVELVSVNACFYVKTWRSNDGFLGDGSFQAGIRATDLRPGRDRGTSLITGVSDAMFELLKWHYIEVNDDTGWDAATDVIARAVTQVAAGTRTESAMPPPVVEARDLLDDLDEVLGVDRVKLADIPALLRELAPRWAPYRNLMGTRLREQLAGYGVRVTNTGNILRVDPAEVRRVLAARSTADLDG